MAAELALSVASGSLVGFVLAVLGSGGSILALPLLVYVVGYGGDPHVAIGTTALAVAASAAFNAWRHRAGGNVRFRTGLLVAVPGAAAALVGAQVGLLTDGDRILALFALVLLLVAWRMWRGTGLADAPPADRFPPGAWKRLVPLGAFVGLLSGFFGIGGGFLVVPALVWAGRLDLRTAVGTSLVAVAAFGLATATRYALADRLDLPVAGLFAAGALVGGLVGTRVAGRLPQERLRHFLAAALVLVAGYMLWRNASALV